MDALILALDALLTCDICIVGAGPVGLTMARELIASGKKVLLLESGGETAAESQDELSRQADGVIYGDTEFVTNIRRVGGNSHAWNIRRPDHQFGVRFANLQPADHEEKADIPFTGWPLTHADLSPFVQRAAEAWRLNYDSFDPASFVDSDCPLLDLGTDFETSMFQFPEASTPVTQLNDAIESSDNITIIRNATVTNIQSDADGAHAQCVHVKSPDGKTFQVQFDKLVLSASGMGTARILLNSKTATGYTLGNKHDTVGRYLIDHPLLDCGDFIPADDTLVLRSGLYDLCARNGEAVMGFLHPSDDALRRQDILNLGLILMPCRDDHRTTQSYDSDQAPGIRAAIRVRDAITRKSLPEIRDIGTAMTGIGPVLRRLLRIMTQRTPNLSRGGWSTQKSFGKPFRRFQLLGSGEQAPHPDNRLYLSNQQDRLGVPKLMIDWVLHDEDAARLYAAHNLLRRRVSESGLGRIEAAPGEPDRLPVITTTCGHHMGVTRMGSDPRTSVVDANCKVHGVDNVYVASTGVMPTGGFANPTLTAAAFGVMIADELKH